MFDNPFTAALSRFRGSDAYDTGLEIYYFTKEKAVEAAENMEDRIKVVQELLKRAAAMGTEFTAKTVKAILEIIGPAVDMGAEWAGIALDMLAQHWGFHRGDGQAAASGVVEVELADMVARHNSPCPTE